MRIGSLMKKEDRGLGLIKASSVASRAPVAVELSVFYSVLDKARDRSWMIGDQAMRKTGGINGGCF